jgi:hypothetical protein
LLSLAIALFLKTLGGRDRTVSRTSRRSRNLRQGIKPIRTFDAVADEMKLLYQRILIQNTPA